MTALLERGQAEVLVAENGVDAIALIEETSGIDLVLMDIMMPEMDGYTAMRTIRALGRFDALPIIAVTGNVVAGERERCHEAGRQRLCAQARQHRSSCCSPSSPGSPTRRDSAHYGPRCRSPGSDRGEADGEGDSPGPPGR